MTTSYGVSRHCAALRTLREIVRNHSLSLSLSLSLSSATVIVLLASSRVSWGQYATDDAWPTFGQNNSNNCRAPDGFRGPHCEPRLRWWAKIEDDTAADSERRHGVAIGRLFDERVVVVGNSEGTVFIFPFQPQSSSYDPNQWSETGATPLLSFQVSSNYPINSTPVLLPDERVVIQTQYDIQCWQIANDFGWGAFLDWRFPSAPGPGVRSHSSSAKIYKEVCSTQPAQKIIAIANDSLYAMDIETGAGAKIATLTDDSFYEHNTTPAIGYRADDECGQFIYAAHRLGPEPVEEVPHFFAIDPAIEPSGSDPTNTIVWRHPITRPNSFPGTLASPSVIDAGPVIIPADDGYLYEFYNDGAASVDDPPILLTGQQEPLPDEPIEAYLSGTAAIGPNNEIIFWGENAPNIHMFIFGENSEAATPLETSGTGSWVHGAPALALFDIHNVVRGRLIVNTPGNPNSADGCRVFEVRVFAEDDELPWETLDSGWSYPTNNPFLPSPIARTSFNAPVAMDEDGTVYCINQQYIIALRPPLGDFDGDCDTDCVDFDAFVTALVDRPAWEADIGEPIGVNLLGIGDCNNDGVFNNYDIDCIEELICPNNLCCMEEESYGGSESSGSRGSNRERVRDGFAYLHAVYGD